MKRKSKKRHKKTEIPAPKVDSFPNVHRAAEKPTGSEDQNVSFSFRYLDTSSECSTSWTKEEIKRLFNTLEKASKMDWEQIKKSDGMDFKQVSQKSCSRMLSSQLVGDISLFSMRVSKKSRIFGTKVHHCFFLIWLDKNHTVLPN